MGAELPTLEPPTPECPWPNAGSKDSDPVTEAVEVRLVCRQHLCPDFCVGREVPSAKRADVVLTNFAGGKLGRARVWPDRFNAVSSCSTVSSGLGTFGISSANRGADNPKSCVSTMRAGASDIP